MDCPYNLDETLGWTFLENAARQGISAAILRMAKKCTDDPMKGPYWLARLEQEAFSYPYLAPSVADLYIDSYGKISEAARIRGQMWRGRAEQYEYYYM